MRHLRAPPIPALVLVVLGLGVFGAVLWGVYFSWPGWRGALGGVSLGVVAVGISWIGLGTLLSLSLRRAWRPASSVPRAPERSHVGVFARAGTLRWEEWQADPVYERFTAPARRALRLAQEEARLRGHRFIGTGHVLLGLLHEGEGIGGQALIALGISLDKARDVVVETIGPARFAPTGSSRPFTPRAKKVFELALRESLQLADDYVATEHLLLGIVREGRGVAAEALARLGADLPRVRQEVMRLVVSHEGGDPREPRIPGGGMSTREVREERSWRAAAGAVARSDGTVPSGMLEGMFERFTDRARRVLVLAQEEAHQLNHSFIGTEHILLGLIHEGEGLAAKALEQMGISLEAVREKVEETIGPAAAAPTGSPPFTPRAKKVLELSLREALQLGHNYIGTEHMLLGLVREGEGVAAQVLQSLGADLSRVRQQVIQLLSGYQERGQSGSRGSGSSFGDAPPLFGERGYVYATGDSWSVHVVRAGRTPADYTEAYEALAELARGLGAALDELPAARIIVASVQTTDGPGLSLSVKQGAPQVVAPRYLGDLVVQEVHASVEVSASAEASIEVDEDAGDDQTPE